MIVPVTLFGLIVIVWLQHTYMSNDNDKPLYRRIFNRIKLPTIYLCIICIVYFYILKPNTRVLPIKVKSLVTDQKVFNVIPPF